MPRSITTTSPLFAADDAFASAGSRVATVKLMLTHAAATGFVVSES